MTAKAVLHQVLTDQCRANEDKLSDATRVVRKHHMGASYLAKLGTEWFGKLFMTSLENASNEDKLTVDLLVKSLVNFSVNDEQHTLERPPPDEHEEPTTTIASTGSTNTPLHDEVHDSDDESKFDDDLDDTVADDGQYLDPAEPKEDPDDSHGQLQKARQLALKAISGYENQRVQPAAEEQRSDYDTYTVSTSTPTPITLNQFMEKMEKDREESRERETNLIKKIDELSDDIRKLTTIVIAQAEAMKEERTAAQDREVRLQKKIQSFESTVLRMSESVTETMTNAVRESKENQAKTARKLSEIKTLSIPRQGNPENQKEKKINRESQYQMNRGSASDSSLPETPPGACPPQTDKRRPMHDKKMRAETEPRASDESSRMRQTWAEVARQPETQSMEKNERVDTSKKHKRMNSEPTKSAACAPNKELSSGPSKTPNHPLPISDDEDDDALWTLVAGTKPTGKKAVVYIGNLKLGAKENEVREYVRKRCEKLHLRPPRIFNSKMFEKEPEDGEIVEFSCARLTIDHRSLEFICNRQFWPGSSYARPWNFHNNEESKNNVK